MKKTMLFISLVGLLIISCTQPSSPDSSAFNIGKQSPRVLIITTGIIDEEARLPAGIVVAIQSLNKRGVPVRLETRNILYDYNQLNQYTILILSTFPGYHDADRKYSLSFMSDEELSNISKFVKNGGVIITGDHVGRNFNDGTDRITEYRQLNSKNWELASCYGVSLTEKNLTGFRLEGDIPESFHWKIPADELIKGTVEFWTMVVDSITSGDQEVLGYWIKDTDSIEAVVKNHFGNGTAYLMSSSGLLQPINEGGYWSVDQLDQFYGFVIEQYNKANKIGFKLNPWPNGYDFAFCVSINAVGNKDQFERIFQVLADKEIEPTIFVNGIIEEEISSLLKQKKYSLQSSGYAYTNFRELKYPQAVEDILRNEYFWDRNFTGFRFPYTSPGFYGFLALDGQDYKYESSIGANNLEFIHGSVFPYNLVLGNNGIYKSTDILEIAATYHDDYHFLKADGSANQVENKIKIYNDYLINFWEYAVKPYHGLMVFLGHPQYVGMNDTTVTTLTNLIATVKKDNTWLTSMDEVASFRKNLDQLQFYVENNNQEKKIHITAPKDVSVENAGLRFPEKIKSAKAKNGEVKIVTSEAGSLVLFNAFNGQELTIIMERTFYKNSNL